MASSIITITTTVPHQHKRQSDVCFIRIMHFCLLNSLLNYASRFYSQLFVIAHNYKWRMHGRWLHLLHSAFAHGVSSDTRRSRCMMCTTVYRRGLGETRLSHLMCWTVTLCRPSSPISTAAIFSSACLHFNMPLPCLRLVHDVYITACSFFPLSSFTRK